MLHFRHGSFNYRDDQIIKETGIVIDFSGFY